MELKRYFEQLQSKLRELEQHYAQGLLSSQMYQQELQQLTQTSEFILDEWIKFEDALAELEYNLQKQKGFHPQPFTKSMLKESTDLKEESPYCMYDWQQGKAFYHLMMFKKAIPSFERVLEKQPEFELARLFLGHCYLATHQLDEAKYHLQFLLETTGDNDIYHLVANGLACLEGTVKAYELAHHYFEKIDLTKVRDEWRVLVLFNHALTLYQLNWLEQSMVKWQAYIKLAPDDWKGLYWLGQVYFQMGDKEAACARWFDALQLKEDPQLLKRVARHFEQQGLHSVAAHCYQRLFKVDGRSTDIEAWSGLAWNYGLTHDIERSKAIFLKAMTLFPEELSLPLAYAWMLLYWKKKQEAQPIIARLETWQPNHPLVLGLKDLSAGRWVEEPAGVGTV